MESSIIEEDNEINYLDLKLIRRNGIVTTQWYAKKTSSGRYMNFQSSAPTMYKRNVVNNLINRAINFTNPQDRPEIIKKVKTSLLENGYPEGLINNSIKTITQKFYNQVTYNKEEKKPFLKKEETLISLPYIQGVTEQLKKSLEPFKIKIISSTADTFNHLYTNLKSSVNKEKITHTVYKINCNDCNGTYIGQSKQYLDCRIKAHRNSVTGKNTEKTALKKHVATANHTFNFNLNDVKILNKETNEKRRLILEMVRIRQEKNSINDRRDTDSLSNCYNQLLKLN